LAETTLAPPLLIEHVSAVSAGKHPVAKVKKEATGILRSAGKVALVKAMAVGAATWLMHFSVNDIQYELISDAMTPLAGAAVYVHEIEKVSLYPPTVVIGPVMAY